MDYFANDKDPLVIYLKNSSQGEMKLNACLEPISYANGSSLTDPTIAYGIVFQFHEEGIYTFKDGTDSLIRKIVKELRNNGAIYADSV